MLVLVPVIAAASGDDVDRWALRNVGDSDSDEALVAGATAPLPPSRSISYSSTESKDAHAASAGWIASSEDEACIICSCKWSKWLESRLGGRFRAATGGRKRKTIPKPNNTLYPHTLCCLLRAPSIGRNRAFFVLSLYSISLRRVAEWLLAVGVGVVRFRFYWPSDRRATRPTIKI